MSLPSSYNLLTNYPNKWFVETGSYRGDAVQAAINAGFGRCRSIDISSENIQFCRERFDLILHNNPLIEFYTGDSADDLHYMINNIHDEITFWLDSHWQLFEDEPKGENPFPLLRELEQISRHPIKTHTILIDDILVLTHPSVTGWSLKRIKDAVSAINPEYKFELIANPVVDNLLICTV